MRLPSDISRSAALAACALLLIIVAVAAPGASAADPERYLGQVFSDVTVTHDLAYGEAPANGVMETLRLDLYEPSGDGATARPVIVFAHGAGQFAQGDKAIPVWFPMLNDLARRGYVIASINFRLIGSQQAAVDDMKAAVRWFRANSSQYRIDTSRIITMGSSSGGIQALETNFTPEHAGDSGNPGYPSDVAGAISVSLGVLTNIDIGEKPIAIFQAADDPVLPLSEAGCVATMAKTNVCEMYRYLLGGHGQDLLASHHAEIMQQISDFLCRNVLGPTMCAPN